MKKKVLTLFLAIAVLITGVVYCLAVKPFEDYAEQDLFEVKEADDGEEGNTVILGDDDSDLTESAGEVKEDTTDIEVQTGLYLHICGAVLVPGVYVLPVYSRVHDAVDAAGGFTEDAAEDYINLAEKVSDGQRIYIPFLHELEEAGFEVKLQGISAVGTADTQAGRIININTASKEVLMTLPGIGESRAQSIIDYRVENGGFHTCEDIMKVAGIKEAMYETLKDYITTD